MANGSLVAGIRHIYFVFGARSLWIPAGSRASAFVDKQNLKTLLAGFKTPKRSPLPVIQNWVEEGNKLSPSELRIISKTLVKSKRYNHALELTRDNRIVQRDFYALVDYKKRADTFAQTAELHQDDEYID